ncbi:MAG TPA: hypothetical protein VMP03_02155 [Methylomirabilota bacterium]|nr:hypothetical protein [Methylomirabilota bacterium]
MLHHLTSIGAGSVGVVALLASLGLVAPEQAPPHVLLDLRPDAEAVRDASKHPNIIFVPLTVPELGATPEARPTPSVTPSQTTDRIDRVFRATDTGMPATSMTPDAEPSVGLQGLFDPPDAADTIETDADPAVEAEVAPSDPAPTGSISTATSERSGLRRGLDEPAAPRMSNPGPVSRFVNAPPAPSSMETVTQQERFQYYFPDPPPDFQLDSEPATEPAPVETAAPVPPPLPEAVQRPAVDPAVLPSQEGTQGSAPAEPAKADDPEETAATEQQSGSKFPTGAAGCTKYKTYNPETQTYRGFDGLIHACKPK